MGAMPLQEKKGPLVPPLRTFLQRLAGYAGATAVGMAFLLMASPILTRVYGPSDFGAFGIYTGAVAVLGLLATLRYELAIVIPERDRDAWAVFGWSAGCASVLAVLLFILLAFFFVVAPSARGPLSDTMVWAIPLGTLSAALQSAMTYWAIRRGKFRALGASKLMYGGIAAATQVVLGVLGWPSGLVVGELIGRAAAVLVLAIATARSLPPGDPVRRTDLWAMARRFARFTRMAVPAALINNVGLLAPLLLVAHLYGPVASGLFVLGQRMIGMPSLLLGEAAGQIYTGEAARVRHGKPDALRALFVRASAGLALIGVPAMATIAVAGPAAFVFVFGPEWGQAGAFARILAFGFAGQFMVGPVSLTLFLLELPSWQLAWDVLRLVGVSASLLLAAALGASVQGALLALSIAMVMAYAILWCLSYVAAQRHGAGTLRPTHPVPGGGF